MGLEYIVHPQVFLGGLTALGPGIQGLTEQYPLLTTYNYWTSTASVNASAFPIPGTWSIYNNPNNSASFIVTVGGLVQTPDTYSINIINRLLTFNSVISAGIEVGATQLATAAPSSISYNYIKSVNSVITNLTATSLTAINGSIENLFVTNLTALSTTVNVIDIQYTELSGFDVTGNVNVFGNINVTDSLNLTGNLVAEDIASTDATFTNLTATDFTTSNLIVSNLINSLTITNLTATNLTATNLTANNVTANNVTVNGNVSASGNIAGNNLPLNFYLNANRGSLTVTTAVPYFDTANALVLAPNKIYELDYDIYYGTVTGTSLRYVLSANRNLANIVANHITSQSGTGGLTATGNAQIGGIAGLSAIPILLPPFTITAGVTAYSQIKCAVETLSDPTTFILSVSGITGTVTPMRGSKRTAQLLN
jgi:hypothetical protein